MNFTALLFCQDEKTARLTTQILNELEFTVETSGEPFAAVKKLMAQHFDAVVVDCENEQNASLLFKGARNSQLNQSSLAVAVVEGQAGVANAFRIGANLVLTKPINVEQAKGTLRVARGLLKKGGETAKAPAPSATASSPAAAPAAPSAPASTSAQATPSPKPAPAAPIQRASAAVDAISKAPIAAPPAKAMAAPVMSKPSTDNVFDLESDATEHAEEVLLDLDEQKPASKPELKTSMKASSLLEAEQVSAKPAPPRPSSPVLTSGGAGAAPAPAKAPEFEKIGDPRTKPQFAAAAPTSSAPMEAPGLFSQRSSAPTFGGLDSAEPESSGGAAKYGIIAVAIVALAVAGYFGYTKFHKQSTEPAAQVEQVSPSVPSAPAEVPSAIVTPEPAAKPKASVAEKPSAEVSATSRKAESAKSESVKPESPKAEDTEPEVVVKNFEEPRVVKANPASAPKKKVNEAEVEAPSAIGATAGDQSAISNIVSSASADVPKAAPAPEMLKVSQGVTQGMLLKRVQPVYPHAAMQMRIAGSVQLQATIDKGGSISAVKVLSGDPILAKAAVDAVKQWRYKPYTLDGEAVDIQTQVTVNFKLP